MCSVTMAFSSVVICDSRVRGRRAVRHPSFKGSLTNPIRRGGGRYHRSMAGISAQSRGIERIGRLCLSTTSDALSLRVAVLAEIRPVVGFDAHAWLLTDPETEVGSAPLADVPCLPELPRLIRLKYLTPINRWTAMDTPVARLHTSTEGRLERSLVWREMLSRHGVTDVASLVFRCRYGCWGFLDLWRTAAGRQFTDAEA